MNTRGTKRTIQGMVVSDRMDKTVVVLAERLVKHPKFHKYIKRHVKYKAHDKDNRCGVGDMVVITESRPFSREKRWRVSEILEKAK